MRLQKYLSLSGVCSRRTAEEYIAQGRVTLNGVPAVVGDSAEPGVDVVCLDGREVSPRQERTYIILNKPRGYVTTLSDPQGRPTVAELVRDAGVRLFPVGRLDLQSEGLLLLTDDGETANRLAHPSHGVKKTYRVWVHGENVAAAAEKLRHPINYEGVSYRPAQVEVRRAEAGRAVLDITVSEGKNREVRRMCAYAALKVERLVRIRQGELTLGKLAPGRWRYLSEAEIESLRRLK